MELVKSLDFVQLQTDQASPYKPEFVARIKESRKEAEEGKTTKVDKENLSHFLGLE